MDRQLHRRLLTDRSPGGIHSLAPGYTFPILFPKKKTDQDDVDLVPPIGISLIRSSPSRQRRRRHQQRQGSFFSLPFFLASKHRGR